MTDNTLIFYAVEPQTARIAAVYELDLSGSPEYEIDARDNYHWWSGAIRSHNPGCRISLARRADCFVSMRNADGSHYIDVFDSWGSFYERKLMSETAARQLVAKLRQSSQFQSGDYGIWQLKIWRENCSDPLSL